MSQGSVYRKNSSPQYAHSGSPRGSIRDSGGRPRFSCEPTICSIFGAGSSQSSARAPAAANATQAGESISVLAKIGWLRSVTL